MPASRALQTPKTPVSTWERPFVIDRNICHFLSYGGVAGEGLRSVGVEPPSPHPRACALSCPSLDIGGPGKSLVGQPRPAARCESQRRANRYSPQSIARAPTTASAASTQKSIESMHSSLSLAVGYNSIVTHSRRSCNNVVAILAKDKAPSLCSRCRTPASILSLAALFGHPSPARPSLAPLKRCAGPRVVRP